MLSLGPLYSRGPAGHLVTSSKAPFPRKSPFVGAKGQDLNMSHSGTRFSYSKSQCGHQRGGHRPRGPSRTQGWGGSGS